MRTIRAALLLAAAAQLAYSGFKHSRVLLEKYLSEHTKTDADREVERDRARGVQNASWVKE
jgi:hypothetical protein